MGVICVWLFVGWFVGSHFMRMMKDCGLLFRGCLIISCHIFEKYEIVKTCTAPAPELNFQDLEGFGSVCFCRVWGFGFWMALGSILGTFWLPKSMENGIDFGGDV